MKEVYIVHLIDTEGPLTESLEATFERIKNIYHIDLKPSTEMLKKLQEGKVNLKGLENSVKNTLNPHFLNYNNTWQKIEDMLSDCLTGNFREQFKDSKNHGWIYNWCCVDHVDYEYNPRSREMGFHKIFDKYKSILQAQNINQDGFHFHYHPHPLIKHAHLCATRWMGPTDKLFQILSRKVIDRQWFPGVNRPGFQVTRPDSHWFLEQFIPFDYASLATDSEEDPSQFDLSAGRLGDWRRAPITWQPYHPSHEDYQLPGNCNRWIARCLNIGTRFCNINEQEINRAFSEAREEKPTIMSFANSDFRNIRLDIKEAYKLIKKVSNKFPDVKFINSEASNAMRKSLKIPFIDKCKISLDVQSVGDDAHILNINSSEPIFGPQPFLALKSKNGDYYHDNLDFQIPKKKWTYNFDFATLPLKMIDTIGVAANNSYGITTVSTYDVSKKQFKTNYLNQ